MTSIINQRTEFGGITAMGGPLSTPLVAIAGPRRTILRAAKSSGQMVFLGESVNLGAEPLAVDNTSVTYHVLTANGMTRVSSADAPAIVSTTAFDPGDGRWIINFTNGIATPLKQGGVQTLHPTTGAVITKFPSIMQDSRFAAGLRSEGFLWVVDGRAARIHAFQITVATGVMQYVGSVAAPNCRDIVKVVLDSGNGNLFVVCRKRLVRFTVPFAAVTNIENLLPTFAQDYGVQSDEYTDLVVLGTNQYWTGTTSPTGSTPPLEAYYGPMLGVWDASISELIVAAPKASLLTVNNVIPYANAAGIASRLAPPIPVITSALTGSTTEDAAWSYTITATGTGPITYGVLNAPSWLTGINAITGVITGTPPDPAVINLTITATNAGGTDTDVLVLTVLPAVASFAAIQVNGTVDDMTVVGNLLYISGNFSSVTDSGGAKTRYSVACLDLSTALWTSWAPTTSATSRIASLAYNPTDGKLYVAGPALVQINGSARQGVGRLTLAGTGGVDAFAPTNNAGTSTPIQRIRYTSQRLILCGSFTTIDATARERVAGLSLVDGTLDSFRVLGPYGVSPRLAGTCFDAREVGSRLYLCGNNTFLLSDSAGGTGSGCSQGVISVDASTGVSHASVHIGSTNMRALATDGTNVVVCGDFFASAPFYTVPFPPGTPTIAPQAWAKASGNVSVSSSFLPTVSAPGSDIGQAAVFDASGDIFLGGSISGMYGSAARRGVQRVTSGGSLVSGFSITWGAGTPNVTTLVRVGPALIVGGSWSMTINGQTRNNFTALDAVTGALH